MKLFDFFDIFAKTLLMQGDLRKEGKVLFEVTETEAQVEECVGTQLRASEQAPNLPQ